MIKNDHIKADDAYYTLVNAAIEDSPELGKWLNKGLRFKVYRRIAEIVSRLSLDPMDRAVLQRAQMEETAQYLAQFLEQNSWWRTSGDLSLVQEWRRAANGLAIKTLVLRKVPLPNFLKTDSMWCHNLHLWSDRDLERELSHIGIDTHEATVDPIRFLKKPLRRISEQDVVNAMERDAGRLEYIAKPVLDALKWEGAYREADWDDAGFAIRGAEIYRQILLPGRFHVDQLAAAWRYMKEAGAHSAIIRQIEETEGE